MAINRRRCKPASGQKRTLQCKKPCPLGPVGDICSANRHVRLIPKSRHPWAFSPAVMREGQLCILNIWPSRWATSHATRRPAIVCCLRAAVNFFAHRLANCRGSPCTGGDSTSTCRRYSEAASALPALGVKTFQSFGGQYVSH